LDLKKYLPNEKISRAIAFVVAAIAVIYMGFHVYAGHKTKYADDFKIYYYTGKAFNDRLNPYEQANISKEAGFDEKTIYRYAPYTLYVFGLLAKLKYDTALVVFIGLKVIMMIFVIYLWMKYFIREKYGLIFTIFLIAGFDAAIYLDLKFCNISIYEQFLIWLGIYFFLQKKHALFSACIIASAMFKFWPILFMFIYLAGDVRKNFKSLVISFAAFTAIQAALYFMMPGLYPSFINSSPITETGGANNSSSYLFIKDFFAGVNIQGLVPVAVYGLWGVLFIAATVFIMAKYKNNDLLARIFIILVTYCVIVPRMKNYSYILLLPVAYYFTTQAIKSKWSWLILLLFSVNMTCRFVPRLVCDYYYLFTLVAVWVFGVVVLKKAKITVQVS